MSLKKYSIYLMFFVLFAGMNPLSIPTAQAGSIFKKIKFNRKMSKANLRQLNEDYNGAIRIYRELYKANQQNAKVNFKMGEC